MPSGTGTSVKGRQVIVGLGTTAATMYLRVTGADALKYEYKGLMVSDLKRSGAEHQSSAGLVELWYSGVTSAYAAAPSGTTRSVVMYWKKAGIPFAWETV